MFEEFPEKLKIMKFMKINDTLLSLKWYQRYDLFFTVHMAIFYTAADYKLKTIQIKMESYFCNCLSERGLPYIFINVRISAL